MMIDIEDVEAGDSEMSASNLRKRYHYGGDKSDAELTASQLRSRYEVYSRSSNIDDQRSNWDWERNRSSSLSDSVSSDNLDFYNSSANQFDGGFDRELANTVCRSIHLNSLARENQKKMRKNKYLRLCLTIMLGLVVFFGLFLYSGYQSEYDEIDGKINKRSHTERIMNVFSKRTISIGSHGKPLPLTHHTHHAPTWQKPCGKVLCMGDRINIDIVDLLLSNQLGAASSSAKQAKSMLNAKIDASQTTGNEQVRTPNIMCSATVMLVNIDEPLNSLIQGEFQVESNGKGEEEHRLVKIKFDGWSGQSSFWLNEIDSAIITPQSVKSRQSFRGGSEGVIEIPLSPCPFSLASNAFDSSSIALQGTCSVAMREHCELDMESVSTYNITKDHLKSKESSKKAKHTRRASGCTVQQNRVDPTPILWKGAQEWGYTAGKCPPTTALTWAPDQWSHPECSRGLKRWIGGQQGDSSDFKSWKKGQRSLVEDGYCPDPDSYLWLPDVITHPTCSQCIRNTCENIMGKSNSLNISSEERVGCRELDFNKALKGEVSMASVLTVLAEAQDICATSEGSNNEILWEASNILSGSCPSTRLVRWVPDRKIAYSNCSPSLQNNCHKVKLESSLQASTTTKDALLNQEQMITSPYECSNAWINRKELVTMIQSQETSSRECPSHEAHSIRSSTGDFIQSGFIWAAHEKTMSRNSLTSRYCEL